MNFRQFLALMLFAAAFNSTPATSSETVAGSVFLVGDSTMASNTGYGDALCARLMPALECTNLGRGGRSTLSYRTEGLWDAFLQRLKARPAGSSPAYVLVQFGHNDQPGKPGRSTDLATEYPANLKRFVTELRAVGAQPVLVTPITRRTFVGERLDDQLKPWADAMRRVAEQEQVPLVDLHGLSMALVQPLGQAGADELAETAPGERRFDRTHLGERGGCVFGELMSIELARQVPALNRPRQAQPACATILPPAQQFSRGSADVRGWTTTTGGSGGTILRVTTLAADGPGSLKAAVETTGPRIVVFEVGGVIDMAGGKLDIRHPNLTIAGQTAPSPGITVLRAETVVSTHDVIVQHLRFRPGEWGRPKRSGYDQDGLSTAGGAHDVIVDHCSFSWGTDENLSASGPRFQGDTPDDWRRATSHRITYTHNLIYEGLSNSVHEKGEHSKGTLIHDNASQILLYGNAYISNRERNALFKGGTRGAMVNNWIFNPGRRAAHYNLLPNEWAGKPWQEGRLTLVGNAMHYGPDTEPDTAMFTLRGAGDLWLHQRDNVALGHRGKPAPMVNDQSVGKARLRVLDQAELPTPLRIRPAASLPSELAGAVGARPWDRDALDVRVLADAVAGQGRIIDSEQQNPLGPPPPTTTATQRPFDPKIWNLEDMSPKSGWASLFSSPTSNLPPSAATQ